MPLVDLKREEIEALVDHAIVAGTAEPPDHGVRDSLLEADAKLRSALEQEGTADDLNFTVGQLRGALDVLDNPAIPIDRNRFASLLRAAVSRLEGTPASPKETPSS